MISAHLKLIREVSARSEDVALRQLRLRRDIHAFGDDVYKCFGTPKLLIGGFATGFMFDRLRPHWRGIRSGGGLGLTVIKLIPLFELAWRAFGANYIDFE